MVSACFVRTWFFTAVAKLARAPAESRVAARERAKRSSECFREGAGANDGKALRSMPPNRASTPAVSCSMILFQSHRKFRSSPDTLGAFVAMHGRMSALSRHTCQR
jgi:hypothetical protein